MRSKNSNFSDGKLIEALKGFPKFVKRQHSNMRKNQAVIHRISKSIVKELKS